MAVAGKIFGWDLQGHRPPTVPHTVTLAAVAPGILQDLVCIFQASHSNYWKQFGNIQAFTLLRQCFVCGLGLCKDAFPVFPFKNRKLQIHENLLDWYLQHLQAALVLLTSSLPKALCKLFTCLSAPQTSKPIPRPLIPGMCPHCLPHQEGW